MNFVVRGARCQPAGGIATAAEDFEEGRTPALPATAREVVREHKTFGFLGH